MNNAFWEDLNVDWTDLEFRAKFCNEIWQMGFDEGFRIGKIQARNEISGELP